MFATALRDVGVDLNFAVGGSEFLTVMKNGEIFIENSGDTEAYSDKDKPGFIKEATGEGLIEYSGHLSDGKADRSWSKASYKKGATGSPAHYHATREEIYYAIQGSGKVIVDGAERILNKGDQIAIKPGQRHQVSNPSSDEEFVIIVKCIPAWTAADSHLAMVPDASPGPRA